MIYNGKALRIRKYMMGAVFEIMRSNIAPCRHHFIVVCLDKDFVHLDTFKQVVRLSRKYLKSK